MKNERQKQFICDVYWENKNKIYANALLLTKNHYDAEDIAVEVLINALEKYNYALNEKALKSWFFKTKCSRAIDLLRRKKSLDDKLTVIAHMDKTDNNMDIPYDELEKKELTANFWQHFNMLSDSNQKLLILFSYENLSYKKIAKMYDAKVNVIKSRIFYARKLLKNSLSTKKTRED